VPRRADRLAGQVIGLPGKLPMVYNQMWILFNFFHRLVGVVQSANQAETKIQPHKPKKVLMVKVGSTSTGDPISNVVQSDPSPISQLCSSRTRSARLLASESHCQEGSSGHGG
jgi:translation initiation factor 2 subunit 3